MIRQPVVAGVFYPADPGELRAAVGNYLKMAPAPAPPPPKALIVPHAGYIYSGPVAGRAYVCLAPVRDQIHRVVLLGPAHRTMFSGLALSNADAFETPLGAVRVDQSAAGALKALRQVMCFDTAHAPEHSLEVQLPFLQEVLGDFAIIPLLVGQATAPEVGAVVELLWGGPETLVVVSSDLSHYLDYERARTVDAQTARAIETLRPEMIGVSQACGQLAIQGLLLAAARCGLKSQRLDLRNSGDTAGPRDQVVGYGAFGFVA